MRTVRNYKTANHTKTKTKRNRVKRLLKNFLHVYQTQERMVLVYFEFFYGHFDGENVMEVEKNDVAKEKKKRNG